MKANMVRHHGFSDIKIIPRSFPAISSVSNETGYSAEITIIFRTRSNGQFLPKGATVFPREPPYVLQVNSYSFTQITIHG